jgi:diguanylate cyclase (GGDEF)-like protein
MNELLPGLLQLTACRERDAAAQQLAGLAAGLLRVRDAEVIEIEDRDDGVWVRTLAKHSGRRDTADGPCGTESHIDERPDLASCLARGYAVAIYPGRADGVHVFPVRNRTVITGMLRLQCREALGSRLASLAGQLVDLYANHVALLDDLQRDTLTGLHNRETLLRHFAGDRRTVKPGARWLVMVDIDHFKRVNDQYGHLVGDEVLRGVARLLRRSVRSGDHVFRFGGEEFVLLLEDVPAGAETAIIERVRERVAGHVFSVVGRVTISLGATVLSPTDLPDAAFYRADGALYHAKRHGRNLACIFEDLLLAGLVEPPPAAGGVGLFSAAA